MPRTRIKDELILTASPELAALVDEPHFMERALASAIVPLGGYLKTQENEHTEIRLRVADVRVLRKPEDVAPIPLQHDCDECRAGRFETEFWLTHNPGGVMILVLFEYDELPR